MNRCDWIDCLEMGLWDGVENVLLNSEGQRNVLTKEAPTRFTYLCPKHFALGVATLNQAVGSDAAEKSNSR